MPAEKELQFLLAERERLAMAIQDLEEDYKSGSVSKIDYELVRERYERKLREVERKLGIGKAEAMRGRRRRTVALMRERRIEEKKPGKSMMRALAVLIPIAIITVAVIAFWVSNQPSMATPQDWEVYTNEEYGYSFRYPVGWVEFIAGDIIHFIDPSTLASVSGSAIKDERLLQFTLNEYVGQSVSLFLALNPDARLLYAEGIQVSGAPAIKNVFETKFGIWVPEITQQGTYRFTEQEFKVKLMQITVLVQDEVFILQCLAPEDTYEQMKSIFNQIVESFTIGI